MRKTKMRWNVSQAKQRFSEVVKSAATEPQLIFNRERLVAAVVDGETLQASEDWQRERVQASLAERLASLREIAADEGYDVAVPERIDRVNTFVETIDDVSN